MKKKNKMKKESMRLGNYVRLLINTPSSNIPNNKDTLSNLIINLIQLIIKCLASILRTHHMANSLSQANKHMANKLSQANKHMYPNQLWYHLSFTVHNVGWSWLLILTAPICTTLSATNATGTQTKSWVADHVISTCVMIAPPRIWKGEDDLIQIIN